MPAIDFDIYNPHLGKIRLWHLQEDELYFLTRLKLYEHEWEKLATITHAAKRLEWLASRLCMKQILALSHTDRVQSLSQVSGKPYLSSNSHYISYTHSHKYMAAIASSEWEVGIDIEYKKRKRNLKTRRLFMNAPEMAYYEANPSLDFFLLIWSIKETLYKIYGERGTSFKEHIWIDVEQLTLQDNGMIPCFVRKNGIVKQYNTYYAIHPEFVLTYAFDHLAETAKNGMVLSS